MTYGLRVLLAASVILMCGASDSQAVLQSGSSEESAANVSTEPAQPARATMRLKFKSKDKPAAPATTSAAVSQSVSTNYSYDEYGAEETKELSDDGAYEMRTSKRVHPLSARPEGTSPVVQTVTGPRTLNYGAARPASVLYPGRSEGGMGTARIQSRSDSQTSNSGY